MICRLRDAIKVADACIKSTVHFQQVGICLLSGFHELILKFRWNHNISLCLTRSDPACPIFVYLVSQLFCTTKDISCQINNI